MVLLESVPNVSEGRDPAIVAALAAAFASAGARLLDTHVDAGHHRSVFTLVGGERALEDGLVAGVAAARRLVDLRAHVGVHPRVGAADVVPVVPLTPSDLARAESVARRVAARVGEELGLPVFLYGTLVGGVRPAHYRRGGPAELQRRIESGELAPAFGPARLDSSAGAVLVGVRKPLVAFNVEIEASFDVAVAIAVAIRESGGGLPGVQALGLQLPDGTVQVSTNVVELDATMPHVMVGRIETEARELGVALGRGELVGLLPAACVEAAARAGGDAAPLDARGVPTPEALAAAAGLLRLERLDADRVLEWHLRA